MARKVDSGQIDQVDEILQQADPEFIESLKEINADELKLADLEAAFAEAEKKNTFIHKFWNEKSAPVRWGTVAALATLILGPLGYLVWRKIYPPIDLGKVASLSLIADTVYEYDVRGETKNFLNEFIGESFTYEIPDQVFHLKPKRGVQIVRFGLILEVTSKTDLEKIEKRHDEMIETLNNVLAKTDVDDFKGVNGKEDIKAKMLAALNLKLQIKFKSLRYSLIVFN